MTDAALIPAMSAALDSVSDDDLSNQTLRFVAYAIALDDGDQPPVVDRETYARRDAAAYAMQCAKRNIALAPAARIIAGVQSMGEGQ